MPNPAYPLTNVTDALSLLEDVVKEYPDGHQHTQTTPGVCEYESIDGELCFIGAALLKAGYPVPGPESEWAQRSFLALNEQPGYGLPQAVAELFSYVQFYQDAGRTWAEALVLGRDEAGRLIREGHDAGRVPLTSVSDVQTESV